MAPARCVRPVTPVGWRAVRACGSRRGSRAVHGGHGGVVDAGGTTAEGPPPPAGVHPTGRIMSAQG